MDLAHIYCAQRSQEKLNQPTKNTGNERIIGPFPPNPCSQISNSHLYITWSTQVKSFQPCKLGSFLQSFGGLLKRKRYPWHMFCFSVLKPNSIVILATVFRSKEQLKTVPILLSFLNHPHFQVSVLWIATQMKILLSKRSSGTWR